MTLFTPARELTTDERKVMEQTLDKFLAGSDVAQESSNAMPTLRAEYVTRLRKNPYRHNLVKVRAAATVSCC
jgi:hypothetical protein